MPKSGRLELVRTFIGLSSTAATSLASKAFEFGEKTQNKGYYAVQGRSRSSKSCSISRKPVCDFLLVINSNWHQFSYRFGVIAAYCATLDTVSLSPLPFAGLGTTYDVYLGKRVVYRLPINVYWTFFARCYGWGATSVNRSKIGDFAPTRSVWSKISGKKGCPHQSFLHG